MLLQLKNSPLFSGIPEADIEHCIRCSKAEIKFYDKDEFIFHQQDAPQKLFVLLEGSVAVGNDSIDGRRSIVATFGRSGELFGEVFLFIDQKVYDHYAQAVTSSKVLAIPKDFLCHTCGENCGCHTKLISNMLSILANKAYYLNQKVQLLSCATLRQKIAKTLLKHALPDGSVALSMNREELADFLNTARPSLSRTLMEMQADGLIKIKKKTIYIADLPGIQKI